ncbi:hypothetical protein P152DRAFT_9766 [Eremomyces bilateralis CBS 781.70]|uniref:Uncharacterized protein n=1 Tax=Eremomyces bilateralis CBS 781.70 TaxID=1392243 RepID=A0A6G1GGG6_9PEZI|nr:uncharacterized protein P152DRAFT_9766 [Eremomyces bilateralis CBS 781.70]KAF1817158.1 hypothetical protein P152DRAFT_9766 [Eremomyces bilateralis CBS 781.70]
MSLGEDSIPCRRRAFDTRLAWDYHREEIETRVTKRLSALSALASSTWGTGTINLRQGNGRPPDALWLLGMARPWRWSRQRYGTCDQEDTETSSPIHHWSLPHNGRCSGRYRSTSAPCTTATRTNSIRSHNAHHNHPAVRRHDRT